MAVVLLCATDAGGVRNLSPLLPALAQRSLTPMLITRRDLRYLLGEDAHSAEQIIDHIKIRIDELPVLLTDISPLALILGTARYGRHERELICLGKLFGIRTVVMLDEWFEYRERFMDPSNGRLTYLPDAIAVQDEQALNEATDQGIPPHLCVITGSPALMRLTNKALHMKKKPPVMPAFLSKASQGPVVTFISETHSKDYGNHPGGRGALGCYIGYTENTVREMIIGSLERINAPVNFVEKLHPDHRGNYVHESNGPVEKFTIRNCDLWALLWHSDIVIGMQSMALLEAHILGCEVVSYQPDLLGLDTCTAVRLGLIQRLDNKTQLKQWCSSRLTTKSTERNFKKLACAHSQAGNNILHLALGTNDYEN